MRKRPPRRAPGKSLLAISMDTEDIEDIKMLAEQHGFTTSAYVRGILKKEVENLAPKAPQMLPIHFETDTFGKLRKVGGAVQLMSRTPYSSFFGVIAKKRVGRVLGENSVGVFREAPTGYFPQDGDTVIFENSSGTRIDLARFDREVGEEDIVLVLEPVVSPREWNHGARERMKQESSGIYADGGPMEETVEWWKAGAVLGILHKVHKLNA